MPTYTSDEVRFWKETLSQNPTKDDCYKIIDREITPIIDEAADKLLEFDDLTKKELSVVILKVNQHTARAAEMLLTDEDKQWDVTRKEIRYIMENIPEVADLAAKKLLDDVGLTNEDLQSLITHTKDSDILNNAITIFFMKENLTKKDLCFMIENVKPIADQAAAKFLERRDLAKEDLLYLLKNIETVNIRMTIANYLMSKYLLTNEDYCVLIRYVSSARDKIANIVLSRPNSYFDLLTILVYIKQKRDLAYRTLTQNFRNVSGKRSEEGVIIGILNMLKDFIDDIETYTEKEEIVNMVITIITTQMFSRGEPPFDLTKEASKLMCTIIEHVLNLSRK